MNWKTVFQKPRLRGALCAVLAAALLLSLCLPALGRERLQLHRPETGEIQDIQVLQTGQENNLANPSKVTVTDREGEGAGQGGDAEGENGESVPGQSEENTQGASQSELMENVSGPASPENGPARDSLSDATIGTTNSTDDVGEQGQNDGKQGEEGGELNLPDMAAVMVWYKYGSEKKTIVCSPDSTVAKKVLLGQLDEGELRYAFELTGPEAGDVKITGVSLAVGSGVEAPIEEKGRVEVSVPADPGYRNYIFTVYGLHSGRDENGKPAEQEISFTYVIRCESGRDLELQLHWEKPEGESTITCAPNASAGREIFDAELAGGVLQYRPELTGSLAEDSQIIAAEYTTASGGYGTLDIKGGKLSLQAAEGSDTETYHLRFTALASMRDDEGDRVEETITYTISIVYKDSLDLQLRFLWYDRGITPRELLCDLNSHVSGSVKVNQLSAGALKYEMALVGDGAESARIRAVALQHNGGSTALDSAGSMPMSIPAGENSAAYVFMVTVQSGNQTVNFTVSLRLSYDVRLQLDYELLGEGPQRVFCESGKTVTAETVYDDQLEDGMLSYSMSLQGEAAEGLQIVRVQCYQSGSRKNKTLSASDSIRLLLEGRRTGENSFTVLALDSAGEEYSFTINVPYKHRGENLVKIETNLTNGMTVMNETEVNLSVRAWTEDASGNVVSQIRATGSETILTVTLDGKKIDYISSSGVSQEYLLIPENPEVGDTNTHTLQIYAQDEYGNYGEETLTLIGQRSQNGQVIGTAQIYIDMTVLGLGVTGPISYDVLSKEPISYVVAKAVWGYDAGFPFGAAKENFGYQGGEYSGSFDEGFFLRRLTPGGTVHAQALSGSSWREFGQTEDEVLSYIDNYFGRGTGLATLWRCLYRNGLNLSTAYGDSVGEYDYTSGSGWSYAIGTGAYYPGLDMSSYTLKDGEILTLRYTLAQSWDIGGGTDNYGNTVGYCVSAYSGNFYIDHRMEESVQPDGSVKYQCRCCGITEDCAHANAVCQDQGDGTHAVYCPDCDALVGEKQDHVLSYADRENPDTHTVSCADCGYREAEAHLWLELEDTASCLEPGLLTEQCMDCGIVQTRESPAKGHITGGQWHYSLDDGSFQHYQSCALCGMEIENSRGSHQYVYNAGENDWICSQCNVRHDFDYWHMLEHVSTNCTESISYCPDCRMDFYSPGDGSSHTYEFGSCSFCGAADPNYLPPEEG